MHALQRVPLKLVIARKRYFRSFILSLQSEIPVQKQLFRFNHFEFLLVHSTGCPGVTFHLPRDNQVTDYVRYRNYFPSMTEATACAWVETFDHSPLSSVWSYASSSDANEWLLAFVNSEAFRIHRRSQSYDFVVPQMSGRQKVI